MSVIEKWIRQKVNTDKLSTLDVDSKISAALPKVIGISGPQILNKTIVKNSGYNDHCYDIHCSLNTFPVHARINYDIKYKYEGSDIIEKGYLTVGDFMWNQQGNLEKECFTLVPIERTLDTPFNNTCQLLFQHPYNEEKEEDDLDNYELYLTFDKCDEMVSAEFELIPPEQGVYSAAEIDKKLAKLMEEIDPSCGLHENFCESHRK